MQTKEIKKYLLKIIIVLALITTAFSFIAPSPVAKAKPSEEEVYLGGFPVGIHLTSDGLIVEDFRPIITEKGTFCPAMDAGIKTGDMLLFANDTELRNASDLQKALGDKPSELNIKLIRGAEELAFSVSSIFDPISGAPKLGLIIRNDVSGVGTMTFYDKNGNYCALGHKISDFDENNYIRYQKGKLFEANVLGVYKGKEGEAGALKGTFDKSGESIGTIVKNTHFGTYGMLLGKAQDLPKIAVKLGSKDEVMPGKAYIYSTLEGKTPEKYQIEIVKTVNQSTPEIKGMVIRVTDKRLLESSGGIVQGMSGSPIIQNGKLVGAVTHVFLSDASIGYGVYIDWLG